MQDFKKKGGGEFGKQEQGIKNKRVKGTKFNSHLHLSRLLGLGRWLSWVKALTCLVGLVT